MVAPNELENHNRGIAQQWLAECPESHRIQKYVKLAEAHSAGLAVREGTAYLLVRGWEPTHGDWKLYEVPYCPEWQTSFERSKRHKEEVRQRRADTPSVTVASDGGSIAIEADGTLLLYGGVGGEGIHTVWYDCKGETLSMNKEKDQFLGTFRAQEVKIFASDSNWEKVAAELEYKDLQLFDVYAVDEDGWKIVRR